MILTAVIASLVLALLFSVNAALSGMSGTTSGAPLEFQLREALRQRTAATWVAVLWVTSFVVLAVVLL